MTYGESAKIVEIPYLVPNQLEETVLQLMVMDA